MAKIELMIVDGDRIIRCEIFDEADLDTALARFDALHPEAPRLENVASQVHSRLKASLLPATGKPWRSSLPMTSQSTIAVGP